MEACQKNVTGGKTRSIDEITIGFQGSHARLKQRCGKFKRAGDGFQANSLAPEAGATCTVLVEPPWTSHALVCILTPRGCVRGASVQADAMVLEGGYLVYLVFRGDNTIPIFDKTISPLHNRCMWLFSKIQGDGAQVFWDNLYPSRVIAQVPPPPKPHPLLVPSKDHSLHPSHPQMPPCRENPGCR